MTKPLTSAELKAYIKANTPARTAPSGVRAQRVSEINTALADQDAALGTDPGAVPDTGGQAENASLADQDGALATDPGAVPDTGGQSIDENYTTVQDSRDGQNVKSAEELDGGGLTPGYVPPSAIYPEGEEPSMEWTRAMIDAYAADLEPPLDTTGLANKQAALDAIDAQVNPSP